MKVLRTILQIPLLLLILYIGSVSGYELIRAIQYGGWQHFDWRFYAHTAQGPLEVAVLVWLYRWLGRGAINQLSPNTNEQV
ncbi:hypothetical protein ACXR0O_06520 [Verrucomicrobiota bacterium sgz303538]